MKLEKAIEILSDSANRGMTTFNQDFKDAERLGIEALRRLNIYRSTHIAGYIPLLPGETQD